MEYKVKDLGSYKLHLIKTDKFKTVRIKVFFNAPIKKEEITIRNFLAALLFSSCNKYKTRREMALKCEDLYSCNLGYNISRFGNYSNLYFSANTLTDNYTEEGNLEKTIEFLSDIIYDPDISGNSFNNEFFSVVKNDATTVLNSLKENPSSYSTIRLFENMEKDEPSSFRSCGYIEDLEKITPENLYEYYQTMLDNDIMDIFVIGDIVFDYIENLIRRYFKTKIFKKITIPARLDDKKARNKLQIIKEENDTNQSNLAIGCKVYGLSDYERAYPLTLYNIILGGGTDSKLFREVREKHSLCYYINSVCNKLDNILLIRAGISKNNFDDVIKYIKLEMNSIRKGKFTPSDLENAKRMYLSAIEEIEESQNDIIDSYYMCDLLGVDDIKTKKQKMQEVTYEEIVTVSKKVKMDTIYLLEGVKDE